MTNFTDPIFQDEDKAREHFEAHTLAQWSLLPPLR